MQLTCCPCLQQWASNAHGMAGHAMRIRRQAAQACSCSSPPAAQCLTLRIQVLHPPLCCHGAGEAAAAKARMVQHSLGQIPAWAPNKEQIQDILQVGPYFPRASNQGHVDKVETLTSEPSPHPSLACLR